eukprot:s188_g5.t1
MNVSTPGDPVHTSTCYNWGYNKPQWYSDATCVGLAGVQMISTLRLANALSLLRLFVAEAAGLNAVDCEQATAEAFLERVLPHSGAPVLGRPGENLEKTFEISEKQLLGCQEVGFVPWRFGPALICVAAACDTEPLVRAVAVPMFLQTVGAALEQEEIDNLLVQRIGHWRDMKVDFVVAGFERGGTTSIVKFLQAAEDIYIVPFELSDWARDFSTPAAPAPACDLVDPPSYWPAFMSFALWPASETIARLNDQVQHCATGVWDSRYASHDIASLKVQALLAGKFGAKVILAFRDPIRYVLSSFNRVCPDRPGGRSFIEAAREEDIDPDPYGLRLWKGNFSLLVRRLMDKVGQGAVWLQPFDTIRSMQATSPTCGRSQCLQFFQAPASGPFGVCGVMSVLLLLLPLAFGAELLPKEERMACPYYQTSGCFLDQLEKVCEGEGEDMLAPGAEESIWMCCCPTPYIPCSPNESDRACLSGIKKEIKEKGTLSLDGLLKVRSQLLTSQPETCGKYFMASEKAECGKWPKDMPLLMCEMLTWQWEELGDGNQEEFAMHNCPMIKQNKAKKGDARKGHTLSWDPTKQEKEL